jgi:hypothetical protein
MSHLLHSLHRRRGHRDAAAANGNGQPRRRPSEEERRLLREQVRRFERDLRELAKS